MGQHLELSSADVDDSEAPALRLVRPSPLDRWLEAVHHAEEACLVLDAGGVVLGISNSCLGLLGFDSDDSLGRGLLDVMDFVSFDSSGRRPPAHQLHRMPPIAALRSGTLARGLIRIVVDGEPRTLDAVACPLHADGAVAGSLTVFSPV